MGNYDKLVMSRGLVKTEIQCHQKHRRSIEGTWRRPKSVMKVARRRIREDLEGVDHRNGNEAGSGAYRVFATLLHMAVCFFSCYS